MHPTNRRWFDEYMTTLEFIFQPTLVKVWRLSPPGNCMNFQLCRAAKVVVARTNCWGWRHGWDRITEDSCEGSQAISPKLKIWRKLSQKGIVASLPDVCPFVRFLLHIGLLTSTSDLVCIYSPNTFWFKTRVGSLLQFTIFQLVLCEE